jgi:hypothetical protein
VCVCQLYIPALLTNIPTQEITQEHECLFACFIAGFDIVLYQTPSDIETRRTFVWLEKRTRHTEVTSTETQRQQNIVLDLGRKDGVFCLIHTLK